MNALSSLVLNKMTTRKDEVTKLFELHGWDWVTFWGGGDCLRVPFFH